jgi:hypothetical protein
VGVLAQIADEPAASLPARAGRDLVAAGLALAAFAVLCVAVLSFAPSVRVVHGGPPGAPPGGPGAGIRAPVGAGP